MEITYKDLTDKYRWDEIEPVLLLLYPSLRKSIADYKEAYQKFSAIAPVNSRMRIIIEQNQLSTGVFDYEVYGKNGTLVREAFPGEYTRQNFKDSLEQEQGYGLDYIDWAEIAGMTIDWSTLASFPEKDIVAHVLMLITHFWHSDDQMLKVLAEIKAINQGPEQNVVRKELTGSTGFFQIWSENENGVFHGKYTVYWEGGTLMAYQGIMIDGNKEGVWTSWDKNGKISNQIRFSCDRAVEENFSSPWWDDVEDQK